MRRRHCSGLSDRVASSLRRRFRCCRNPCGRRSTSPALIARLRPLLDGPGGNRGPQVIRAELLSQKLGRWTIGYSVTESEPEVIGKMFQGSGAGRRSHQTMQWLWDHAFAVPRPLGFLPELSMLVYQAFRAGRSANGLFDDRACGRHGLDRRLAGRTASVRRCARPVVRRRERAQESPHMGSGRR